MSISLRQKAAAWRRSCFPLMAWGHKNILHDEPHIALVDKESGDVVHNAFVTTKGTVVEPRNIQIVALNLNQP